MNNMDFLKSDNFIGVLSASQINSNAYIPDYIIGPTGKQGKNAYEVAVDNGYSGTVQEWLLSLQGVDGKNTVYVGTIAPQEDYYTIWINPEGQDTNTLLVRPNSQSSWTPIPVVYSSADFGFDSIDNTTLKIEDRVLSVNTTNMVEAGNNQPITSTGVQTVVGNIEVLLNLI